MTNEYHFVTNWVVPGSIQEVYGLISEGRHYPGWWPSVYLRTEEIASGDENGVGRRLAFQTKGWLPYTLRWEAEAVEVQPPTHFAIRATGDFEGRGVWSLRQESSLVYVTFDWQLRAEKPVLRNLSFLFKPIFSANHRWAMDRGYESLLLTLARNHAKTERERLQVQLPPGPNKTSGLWLMAGAAVVAGLAIALFPKKKK